MIKRLDHIAIAVKDIQAALAVYEGALGLACTLVEEIPEQKVKVAFLPTGDSEIELLEPTTEDSGVARFLEKRGEGMHHICVEVDDIEATLAELRARGTPLLDDKPKHGAHGRIAFLNPRGTHGVLIELVERGAADGLDSRR
ncbi:MAG: methylmalonyl-CoA epimerase [Anaerolineae bacterium]|nr:methylmalonyl-CoA epimerase [Anaerolineae bacterium]